MRVCLFEDRWEQFEPLSGTRPVFDLICGITSLGEKQRHWFAAEDWGVCIRPALAPLYRRQHPDWTVNEYGWILSAPLALVNGRWLPPNGTLPSVEAPCIGLANGQVAWALLSDDQIQQISFAALPALLVHWQHTLPCIEAGGRLIDYPWELVDCNAEAICCEHQCGPWKATSRAPAPLTFLGPAERVSIAATARVEPMVFADVTRGPVVIDEHALVTAFTRLEGPCYLGPATQVMGAKIRAGTTVGPHCRIGGEIEASIVHGFSNKYHEGFLGHSYVGEWVNLGAGTHNSDLRNDYGPVSVPMPGRVVRTGLCKVGCFVGDHVKTGLGSLINTGSFLGAFSNLLPAGRLAPKYIPAFTTWWNGHLREEFPLAQLLQTAELMMQRRGQQLTPEHVELYEALYQATAEERQQVLEPREPHVWRRSA